MNTHEIANKIGWTVGEDFPEWGNNPLYLTTITGGYLQKDETPKDAYWRLANTSAKHLKKPEIAQKVFDILWKGWLIPATPVMCNMGTDRGLPISCFSGRVDDSMYDIYNKNLEMAMLSKYGGGTAYDFSMVRPLGSPIKGGANGTSDGIIPFIKSFDSTILASKQGKTRRGATAIYLDVNHPEYESFLRVREPKGDINRQCMNIHQGAVIDDAFIEEVRNKNGRARRIWLDTIKQRIKTGEPYLFFIDNANKNLNEGFVKNNLKIWHSNLCSEIMLPTDPEHTLVCCLSSLNLAKYDEWKDTDTPYIATMFLDSVITEFLEVARDIKGFENAVRFAEKSRALGLGTLGWHTFLQSKMIPFTDFRANAYTNQIFGFISSEAKRASVDMAKEYGEPEWCRGTGTRNLTNMAVAPNRSSAKLGGGVSQSTEPYAANLWVDDDAKGLHIRKNPILKHVLKQKNISRSEYEGIWDQISEDKGSVQGISALTDEEKEVFLTFKEINQMDLVRQAGIRQKYIDQGQSINLAFQQNAPAKFINAVHLKAHEVGLKSLYYFRSESVLRADTQRRDLYSECVMCEG